MRGWHLWIVALFFSLFLSSSAYAQAGTWFKDVGFCDMHQVQQRMTLRDVVTQPPYGPARKAMYLLPPQTMPFASPINVLPDPSGINFLAIRSAVAGMQFWVRWNGEVIGISANGTTHLAGNCAIDPIFVQTFLRPGAIGQQVPMPLQIAYPESGTSPVPQLIATMPQGVFPEAIYTLPPLMATPQLAKSCLEASNRNSDAYFACVIRQATSEDQRLAFECAQRAGGPQDTALCIFAGKLGPNERALAERLRACYRQHADRWDAYSLCMAEDRVDPNLMRLVRCAQDHLSQGEQPNYWSLGFCAFGPQMLAGLKPNPESAIAIDCAVRSGGNPKAFAICTGGQLAVRELDKCLTDGFGEDGCFGKNNTLTQAYDRIGEGIAQAFGGKETAVYRAWQAATVSNNPREAIEAMNNVAREAKRLQYNLSQEAERGLQKMGDAAHQIMPQITIGKPKGKIFGKSWSL